MKLLSIKSSDRPGKRLVASFDDGTKTHFGQEGGSTFIDHRDETKKKNYIARHRVNENWNDPKSPGALARFILWGDSTSLQQNIANFKKRFNL
jgi:hypothetical protein